MDAGEIHSILVAEANRLGLPERFATDLDWDLKALQAEVPPVFGWVLYDCGTHFIRPGMRDGTGARIADVFRKALRTSFQDKRHCYVWTGNQLREMSDADKMLDWLEQ